LLLTKENDEELLVLVLHVEKHSLTTCLVVCSTCIWNVWNGFFNSGEVSLTINNEW